jgi:ABC-type Fe3+ transport system permease subunit
MLAFVQLALCAALALLAQRWGGLAQGWPVLRLGARRYDGKGPLARLLDAGMIALALLLLLPPLPAGLRLPLAVCPRTPLPTSQH